MSVFSERISLWVLFGSSKLFSLPYLQCTSQTNNHNREGGRYLVIINLDFANFCSLFTTYWEDTCISNTRDSVSSAIQISQISSKMLCCMSYFQLASRRLVIPLKHSLSLIFDILNVTQKISVTQSKILNPFEFRILHYKILLLTECINFLSDVGQSISSDP